MDSPVAAVKSAFNFRLILQTLVVLIIVNAILEIIGFGGLTSQPVAYLKSRFPNSFGKLPIGN